MNSRFNYVFSILLGLCYKGFCHIYQSNTSSKCYNSLYCSLQNVFAMVFSQWKINYDDQNVEIWRCNVQCHEVTFLRATRDATSHAQT